MPNLFLVVLISHLIGEVSIQATVYLTNLLSVAGDSL